MFPESRDNEAHADPSKTGFNGELSGHQKEELGTHRR